jgi:hypothetical protein
MSELTGKLGRKPTKEEFGEAWKSYRKTVSKYQLPEVGEWNLEQSNNPAVDHSKPTFTASGTRTLDITTPTSSEAKALEGSYSWNPKPAVEVILVVMKPLSERTYVGQALKNRKGITWLGDARIPPASPQDASVTEQKNRHADFGSGPRENRVYGTDPRSRSEQGNYDATMGRFPANLLVSHDALNNGEVTRGVSGGGPREYGGGGGFGGALNRQPVKAYFNDAGSFSRYFSLDAWWEKKLEELPESVQRTFPFLVVPKASKRERNRGLDELPLGRVTGGGGTGSSVAHAYGSVKPVQQNPHVCVKPLKLMSYLVTLGTRPGDVVLDPFCGSGTSCIAAALLNRHYVGIEIDREYCQVAEKRLAWWKQTKRGLCDPLLLIKALCVILQRAWNTLSRLM